MCGRYTLHHAVRELTERFGVAQSLTIPSQTDRPRYNIAPSQAVSAITLEGERFLQPMRWGLIPSWAKDPSPNGGLINARAETIAEKPSFKASFKYRRCLIPADGFYEWKKGPSGKQPMHIRMRSGELFALAGLWSEWASPDGSPLRTCAIITVEPNALVGEFHNRMPAILRGEAEAVWLDAAAAPQALQSLLAPYPPELMETWPVGSGVNYASVDTPDCLTRSEASSTM